MDAVSPGFLVTFARCFTAIGTDALRGELRWLADRGLVEIEYHDGVQAAKVTQRGLEVSQGYIAIDGIDAGRP